MFDFTSTEVGEKAILLLTGSLSVKDSPRIRSFLQSLKAKGIKELEFDFKDLNYLDSSGIGILLYSHNWMKETNKKVRIRNMNQAVRSIFEIANLTEAFDITS